MLVFMIFVNIFQGRDEKGRMNSRSDDEKYMALRGDLNNKLDLLSDRNKTKNVRIQIS